MIKILLLKYYYLKIYFLIYFERTYKYQPLEAKFTLIFLIPNLSPFNAKALFTDLSSRHKTKAIPLDYPLSFFNILVITDVTPLLLKKLVT